MTSEPLVDFDRLTAEIESKAAQYATAAPFPHIVIDDVLTGDPDAGSVLEGVPARQRDEVRQHPAGHLG